MFAFWTTQAGSREARLQRADLSMLECATRLKPHSTAWPTLDLLAEPTILNPPRSARVE